MLSHAAGASKEGAPWVMKRGSLCYTSWSNGIERQGWGDREVREKTLNICSQKNKQTNKRTDEVFNRPGREKPNRHHVVTLRGLQRQNPHSETSSLQCWDQRLCTWGEPLFLVALALSSLSSWSECGNRQHHALKTTVWPAFLKICINPRLPLEFSIIV